MRVTSREQDGRTVLRVEGRLDTLATVEFEAEWRQCYSAGARRLVLDFAELTYISSSGLGSVVALAKLLGDAGGGLSIAGLRGVVKEVFAISTLDRVIPVLDSVDAALERV